MATFDVPDRMFSSISKTWGMCTTSMSEVKELTPEWYFCSDFLRNANNVDLGTTQEGMRVNDVELPPWAKGSPETFVRQMRAALESDYVSNNLHHWIDLIFGYKQRGPEAVKADNVFYYLTYAGAVDIESIEDPAIKKATEMQIAHFGTCPMQIFTSPHPQRGRKLGAARPSLPAKIMQARRLLSGDATLRADHSFVDAVGLLSTDSPVLLYVYLTTT